MSGGIERLTWSNAEIIKGVWNVLSPPLPAGWGILSNQSMRQVDLSITLNQLLLAQRCDPGEMVLEQRRKSGGKGSERVGWQTNMLSSSFDVLGVGVYYAQEDGWLVRQTG